jgi:hypothetical protein
MQKIIRDDIANLDYVNCPNKIKIYTDKGNYNLGEAVNISNKYLYQIIAFREKENVVEIIAEFAGKYKAKQEYRDLNISVTINGEKIAKAIKLNEDLNLKI